MTRHQLNDKTFLAVGILAVQTNSAVIVLLFSLIIYAVMTRQKKPNLSHLLHISAELDKASVFLGDLQGGSNVHLLAGRRSQWDQHTLQK